MIDLTTLSRIRFRRSTIVHSVTAATMRTGCGRWALLYDAWDRRVAEPLPEQAEVTCRRCVAASTPTTPKEH